MGLDISVYKNLVAKGELTEENADSLYEKNLYFFYKNPDFEPHFMGLNEKAYYAGERLPGFRAGSYSGYGHFKSILAQVVGFNSIESTWAGDNYPMKELINFSDCEGTIGPIVSAKLYQDFLDCKGIADKLFETFENADGEYYKEKYNDWLCAFDAARHAGAVAFH